MPRTAACLSLLLVAFSSCQLSKDLMPADAHSCTLGILRTGARTELTQEESRRYFGGHFANMNRLAKEGHLLIAGPYMANKSAPDLRGIFILDTGDLDEARALAETDPCFQAGIFRFEFHSMRTDFPLARLQKAELERMAAAERAGRTPPPGEGCRKYVMVTVADKDRAHVLRGHDSVYLLATLDDERALAFVDCQSQADAEALLEPLRAQLGELTIDEWFGSDLLAARQDLLPADGAATN